MPENYQTKVEEAIKAVRDEEKKRQENYPDDVALMRIIEYLTYKYITRVGLGVGNETVRTDSELVNTFQWAARQYFLDLLNDSRSME